MHRAPCAGIAQAALIRCQLYAPLIPKLIKTNKNDDKGRNLFVTEWNPASRWVAALATRPSILPCANTCFRLMGPKGQR